jgi:hypothetical protein
MLKELVADCLFGIGSPRAEAWDAIDHVDYEMETIEIVHYAHVKWCAGGTFLLVAAYMQVRVAVSSVG